MRYLNLFSGNNCIAISYLLKNIYQHYIHKWNEWFNCLHLLYINLLIKLLHYDYINEKNFSIKYTTHLSLLNQKKCIYLLVSIII